MKKITTGTKIFFNETKEKFSLKQNETGFDITPVKLSKKLESEHYTFEEFMERFRNGEISIEGFDEHDNNTVEAQIINYMHQHKISIYAVSIDNLKTELEEKDNLFKSLEENNKSLEENNKSLEENNKSLQENNKSIEGKNKSLEEENKFLKEKNNSLEEVITSEKEAAT